MKSFCCLSVLKNYLEWKKYNLIEIAKTEEEKSVEKAKNDKEMSGKDPQIEPEKVNDDDQVNINDDDKVNINDNDKVTDNDDEKVNIKEEKDEVKENEKVTDTQ